MSFALAHFSLGATISLILFRLITYNSDRIKIGHYLRYDILIATFGGLWAMIPDLPYVFDVMKPLVTGGLCNVFFFHCFLDYTLDPHDSVSFTALMFGLFLITVNVLNLDVGRED